MSEVVVQPVMTREQAELFGQFVTERPVVGTLAWKSVGLDVVGDKRVLCLQAPWQAGQRERLYVHFCPDGLTDAECQAITAQHGLPCWSGLEGTP